MGLIKRIAHIVYTNCGYLTYLVIKCLNFFSIWFDYCRNEHGVTYKSGPIAEIIYEASGSSVDWAHAKLGIKYSYALELRDDGTHGFNLPVNEIQPTVEETFAGIVGMADEIYKEFEGKASSSFGSNQNSGIVGGPLFDVLVYKAPTTNNEDDLPQKSPFFSEDWWKTDKSFCFFIIYLHWLTCLRTDYPKLPIFNLWCIIFKMTINQFFIGSLHILGGFFGLGEHVISILYLLYITEGLEKDDALDLSLICFLVKLWSRNWPLHSLLTQHDWFPLR